MKHLLSYLVSLLLLGIIFWGCNEQPLEPVSGGDESLSKNGGMPADGNGNKLVFDWDDTYPVICASGVELTLHDVGWAQFKVFGPPNNRNVELGVFHIVLTFSNSAGDEFVYRDVGPDRVYAEGDEIFVAISGRSSASGTPDRDEINIGLMVINLSTNEVVFIAGNGLGSVYDLACDNLN